MGPKLVFAKMGLTIFQIVQVILLTVEKMHAMKILILCYLERIVSVCVSSQI